MIAHYYPKKKYIALTLLAFISSAENIVIAFMISGLTVIALNGHSEKLPIFTTEVVLFLLIVLVSQLGYNYLKNDSIRYVNQLLRTTILRGMFTHAEADKSEDLAFLTNDFKLLETNRFNAELNIMSAGITLSLSLAYALYINWTLTLIFFFGSCIPLVTSNFFQKPIQEAAEQWSTANSSYVTTTKNFLAGAATIRLYGQEDSATHRNTPIIRKLENSLMRMNLLNAHAQTTVSLIAEIGTFLVPFVLGVLLITHHYASLGSLFAIMQLSNSFVNPILQILSERNNLSTTKAIIEKLDTFTAADTDTIDTYTTFQKSLILQNISLNRDGKQLSDGIDITITPGKKIAIIGASGCGKSTLLQFLINGNFGSARSIIKDGLVVEPGSFYNDFAYASQSPIIFSDSLQFNLTLGADIQDTVIRDVCKHLNLDDIVRKQGLNYSLGDNANQLSGGQLARIELARAILSKRPILLLDEINASLDHQTSKAIHDYLLKSNLTFIEVIHHYEPHDLDRYDDVIDFTRVTHE